MDKINKKENYRYFNCSKDRLLKEDFYSGFYSQLRFLQKDIKKYGPIVKIEIMEELKDEPGYNKENLQYKITYGQA